MHIAAAPNVPVRGLPFFEKAMEKKDGLHSVDYVHIAAAADSPVGGLRCFHEKATENKDCQSRNVRASIGALDGRLSSCMEQDLTWLSGAAFCIIYAYRFHFWPWRLKGSISQLGHPPFRK